jgi:hypothetical protein
MTVDDALAFLGAVAARHREKLRGPVGVAVAGHGRYTLDPAAEDVLTSSWDDAVPTALLVNERALFALVAGRFDPRAPSDGELCAWTGDPAGLTGLADALAAGDGDRRPWQTRL